MSTNSDSDIDKIPRDAITELRNILGPIGSQEKRVKLESVLLWYKRWHKRQMAALEKGEKNVNLC